MSKGANMHVDFSAPEGFQDSFDELIRQITYIERKLSLQPRKTRHSGEIIFENQHDILGRTPAPGPMVNPMKLITMSPPKSSTSTMTNDVNSRRFDAIIREYKRSIQKRHYHLNKLKRNELSDLIIKLRHELFSETSQVLTDGERSEEDDDKQINHTDDQFLQQLLTRSLDQNDILLRLVDRLTTPQPIEPNPSRNLDLDGIIKVILAIMLLYTLNILCQKE